MRRTGLFVIAIYCTIASNPLSAQATSDPPGSAIVDVTVADAFGTPLANVAVTLTGVVDRKATTDAAGAASFLDLPAGRYDVTAAGEKPTSTAPRVIDLKPFTTTPVALTMKPLMSRGGSIACGGYNSRSLSTFAETAHHVVHVKVRAQHTVAPSTGPEDAPRFPLTVNLVDVLQVFKWNAAKGSLRPAILVNQGGGHVDRGDHIDVYSSNSLPPLNPGDEYVLFLYDGDDRGPFIHASEEGAFRVRNGRVEPLGRGGAAGTWKHRPASDFFTALRALR